MSKTAPHIAKVLIGLASLALSHKKETVDEKEGIDSFVIQMDQTTNPARISSTRIQSVWAAKGSTMLRPSLA